MSEDEPIPMPSAEHARGLVEQHRQAREARLSEGEVGMLREALWQSVDGKGIRGRLFYEDCDYLARVVLGSPVVADMLTQARAEAAKEVRATWTAPFLALADEFDEIDDEAWADLGGLSIGGAVRHELRALGGTADGQGA